MSGIHNKIYGSLASHLATYANTKGLRVAWENSNFEPPTDNTSAWLRFTLLPSETRQASVGDDGYNSLSGLAFVNVFTPTGLGCGIANEIADEIISHFKRGVVTPSVNGVNTRIEKSWRSPGLYEKEGSGGEESFRWFNLPVKVKYFVYSENV